MRFFVSCCRTLILGVKLTPFNLVVGLAGILGGVCALVMVGLALYKLWKSKASSSANGASALVDGLVRPIKALGKGGRVYIDYFKVSAEESTMRGLTFESALSISPGASPLIATAV